MTAMTPVTATTSIQIENRSIGPDHEPFIIAEMSGNHNQSLDRALEIVEAAARSGAHALKLQTYTAETMTLDLRRDEFFIDDEKSLWKGHSLYELYEKAHTPWDWHEPLMKRGKELGLTVFSTPFDLTAVDFLEDLNVPFYKIASFENTDHALIRKVVATGKPVIISTGMASVAEIAETVDVAKKAGCKDLVLLKCTSSYPASPDTINLRTIPHLRDMFDVQVGLSDHTLGVGAAVASVALGGTVIEKHFTLSRAEGGVDAAFSLEPSEMALLVQETKTAWQAMGRVCYERTPGETSSMVFRRSLYISDDLQKGEPITEKNLRSIRPGKGLPPKYFDHLLGKRVRQDVPKGTPASWALIE
ncbi:MAG: pseudaminic acid synthase [Vampirovibrio sp.]|nr:pseudaminic acid synthase [Vampirovibrio sp.]